jgi:hypothetical protein
MDFELLVALRSKAGLLSDELYSADLHTVDDDLGRFVDGVALDRIAPMSGK